MLKILDRYILWQFVRTYFVCFFSVTGMYIVFDAFSNLDEFMSQAKSSGDLFGIMGEYYSYRTVYFFDQTSGILALLAAMFTVTWIQRYNELTAMMAAGISKGRVVIPTIVAAALIAALAAANREVLIPRISAELAKRPGDLKGDLPQRLQPRYDNLTDVLLGGKSTKASEMTIIEPKFLLPPSLDVYGKQIRAESAVFLPAEGEHPSGYLMRGVIEPTDLANKPSLLREKQPVLITPHDDPDWLGPDECFVVSNVTFAHLTGGTAWRQFSSSRELTRSLRNPSLDLGADVRVTVHSRAVQPFLDMTLLFLGLPLVLSRSNRNVFLSAGLCLVLVCVFLVFTLGARFLGGGTHLEPALAAWLPLLVFTPIAAGVVQPLLE